MGADIVAISALTPLQRDAWRAFQLGNPALASPYFTLEFAEAVASVRSDTAALLITQNGTLRGFLPMQLSRTGYMRPLGGPMGDHQALITDDNSLDPGPALEAAQLSAFTFHGALASQSGFARMGEERETSWVVDLSDGYEAYMDGRRHADAKAMRNLRSRRRKIDALEDAAVFRIDDRRQDVFETALRMKRNQYRRTRALDVFRGGWAHDLLDALFATRTEALSGLLSTLEVNGELAAAHFGMRSQTVLHYWFPVYSPAHSGLAPGLNLFVELARELSADGITQIQMGGGDYSFKQRFANSGFDTVSGTWFRPGLLASTVGIANRIENFAESLPLGRVSQWPGKAFRRLDKFAAIHGV